MMPTLLHASEPARRWATPPRAEHRAPHPLPTPLPARSHLHESMARTLAGAGDPGPDLAVLVLHLAGFGLICDEHGADAGVAAQGIVATRLARALRTRDTLCSLGGDAFGCLVVVPSGRERLGALAHELFAAMAAPMRVGRLQLCLQPSIGIAGYPIDGSTSATLLRRAAAAGERARRKHLGCAFFERRSDL